jgi:hypothetical protein
VTRFQASLNRAILEIIAKREIPQHFEEGVVPGGIADIVEVVVLAASANAFLRAGRLLYGRVSRPVNTFLNGTMPAFTNMSVGSFCGTSGADGTRACLFFSKNSRNWRRMLSSRSWKPCKCAAASQQSGCSRKDLAFAVRRG